MQKLLGQFTKKQLHFHGAQFFSAGQSYDLAVIGGGPGGLLKKKNFKTMKKLNKKKYFDPK